MTSAIQLPKDLRAEARSGRLRGPTTGHAPGYLHANLMIVPKDTAFDFLLFCQRNPKACPLIEVMEPGQRVPVCAAGADIARDVPGYRVYLHGELAEEVDDIDGLWRDDFVTFVIGCSFSFEDALARAGIALKHVEQQRNVAMYRTNLACAPAGRFAGEMVVSMRPIRSRDVSRAVEVTAAFPLAHGAPLHIGHPAALGIADLGRPDYGDPVELGEDDVPVFWACGVTPQWVAQCSRLPLCLTHSPGKMFVTDLRG